MIDLFARRPTAGRAGMVKQWVAGKPEFTDADLVTVAELTCHEPGCALVETVISVNKSDGTRLDWRIDKPIAESEEPDVDILLPYGSTGFDEIK